MTAKNLAGRICRCRCQVKFGGKVVLSVSGVMEIIHACHSSNVAGKHGGVLIMWDTRGDLVRVGLYTFRRHGHIVKAAPPLPTSSTTIARPSDSGSDGRRTAAHPD